MNKYQAIVPRDSHEGLCKVALKLAGADDDEIEREADRSYPCSLAQALEEMQIRGVDAAPEDLIAWGDDPANAMVRSGQVTIWYRLDVERLIVSLVEADRLTPQARERYNAGVTGAEFAAAFAAQQIQRKHKEYAARN